MMLGGDRSMNHEEPGAGPPAAAGRRSSWLSRNLLVLCGVSFLQDAASELLYPVLPIFLTVTLGAPAAVVGIVEGVAEGAASITKLLAGRVADRRAKRPLIAAGYGLAALGKVVIAVAAIWPVVLAGRVIDRLGKGIRGAPRDALLVIGVPASARGRAFGLHRAMDTAGAVVGPLLGLAAYQLLDRQIRPLLYLAIIPAVLSVLLIRAVREAPTSNTRPDSTPPAGIPAPKPDRNRNHTPLPRRFWRACIPLVAFGLINFPDALLLLRVAQLTRSLPLVVLAYATYNASYALLSYPAGALADRIAPPLVFAAGLLCFAATYTGLALIGSPAAIWPLMIIYGGYTAATDGVGKAWISGLVPTGSQGRAQGIYQGASGSAVLIAGLWAGLAWQQTGRVPLLVSGALAAALAAALLSTQRGKLHPTA